MYKYIKNNAQLDPKYETDRIDRVDVVQGGEGPIPHLHVTMKDGNIAYPRLDVAEYSPHHKNGYKLNAKEKRELQAFMQRKPGRSFIQSFTSEEVRPASNYESGVNTWVTTYGGEEKFTLDSDGFPIQPDYTKLS